MPKTAPGAERAPGGVTDDAQPVPGVRRGVGWRRGLAGPGFFLLLLAVLCFAYLRLSQTYAENSDEANILLMANDMLHGNLFLSGWHVSDVPFITTELPQMALLVATFGLRLGTAHLAAAVTYTLVAGVAMLLAKGRAHGKKAVVRMAVALGILLAPQPGVGIFVADFSVGHIGIAVPVMLTWLVLDRAKRRWWLPVVVALMLAWAETADPLVLVVAILPLLSVCLARVVTGVVAGLRDSSEGTGASARLRTALAGRWLELSLAGAAGVGYAIAWAAAQGLSHVGYTQNPVPFKIEDPGKWFLHARIVVHGLLEIFGAYFVPGQQEAKAGAPAPGALDQVIAFAHLAGVILAIWGACAIIRRFFFRDADFVSQLLLAGIIANLAAYITSTLAEGVTALNTREVAPVLPFAAVLAARMLAERLAEGPLAGPLVTTITVRGRRIGVRAVTATLVLLMAFFTFGLIRQASAPAAPTPDARLVAYLESQHLTYGIGGYWESGLITVESGGKVTIRAVTPACLQPYQWESKSDWYDPAKHNATFLLLDNVPGYFSHFNSSVAGLLLLNRWFGVAAKHETGSHRMVGGYPVYQYEARSYNGNLLSVIPKLARQIPNPPPWLAKELRSQGQPVNGVCS